MIDLAAFAIKLPLALAVFLLIAYAGTVSKRIAGVLLTFPILNGIAVIAGTDPVVVADAIYPLVIFNCVLFALLLSFPRVLPPVSRTLPRGAVMFLRVGVWALAWFAGAYLLTDARHALPGAGVLLAGASVFALGFIALCWSRERPHTPVRAGFLSFWMTPTGLWRIALFALAYACVFWVSRAALDEKWVGMASALPLPGLFALAALIGDAEASPEPSALSSALLPLRDTVFLGPLLVIPFNWVFSHVLATVLPPSAIVPRYLLLFALWGIAAFALLWLIPRLATYFDRRSAFRPPAG